MFVTSCFVTRNRLRDDVTFHIATVNNNVCKRLRGDVVFYAIFVDSEPTKPWTTYDINSTLDSIQLAMGWIEKKAHERNIPLNIKIRYHQRKKTIPITMKFRKKTLSGTVFATNGVRSVNKWADKIAKVANASFGPDTSCITATKIKPKNRDKLIARLRDIYKTDNVALVYFINNYYSDEMSVAVSTGADNDVEYAVVSFKNPSVIAHEFLHLFGALDLYITPFDTKKKNRKRKAFAMKEFPNEIMAFSYLDINELDISPFTEYLIGWRNELDEKYKQMIFGKKIKIAKY